MNNSKQLRPFFRKWQLITIAIFSIVGALITAIWAAVISEYTHPIDFLANFLIDLLWPAIYITVGMTLVSIVVRIIEKKKGSF